MSETTPIDFEQFSKTFPKAIVALRTLSEQAAEGVDRGLIELLKTRASQINGCAFCLQLHLNWARKAGVAMAKLDRLAAWAHSAGFSEEERVALRYTEVLTQPHLQHEVAAARGRLEEVFGTDTAMRLTLAVATINAWNRIAASLGFTPPEPE